MCELCDKNKLTKWWYSDDLIWIANCKTCSVPLGVIHRHAKEPTKQEKLRIELKLHQLAAFLGWKNYKTDSSMRKIKDHYHTHLRRTAPVSSEKEYQGGCPECDL